MRLPKKNFQDTWKDSSEERGKHPTAVREFYTGKEFSEWCPTNEFKMYNGRKVITVPFGM